MNLFYLSLKYIVERKLNTFLNALLLGFGVSIMVLLLLVRHQIDMQFAKNVAGVDMVIGAKGSPLQIILCNLFHIDYPTGNIKLSDASLIAKNRLVKAAIPLALGDSYKGARIIGTTTSFFDSTMLKRMEGRIWDNELEAVVGSGVAARLGLKIGDRFESEHGLSEGASAHEGHGITVVGVFSPTGSIKDNLIFTSVETVWHLHGDHESEIENSEDSIHEEFHDKDSLGIHSSEKILGISVHEQINDLEITSLLIAYRSPMAAVQLPRIVNSIGNLQAASPAFEMARLQSIIGVGEDIIKWLAYLIICIAGLSVFIAIYNALKERKYDLAIMRSLGASKLKIFVHIMLEGLIMATIGGLFGFTVGHLTMEYISMFVDPNSASFTGFVFLKEELWIVLLLFLVGIVAAIIPGYQAYKLDISKVLSER